METPTYQLVLHLTLETASSRETFRYHTRSELVNVAGAIDGTQKLSHPVKMRSTISVVISNTISFGSGRKGKVYRCSVWFSGKWLDARVLRNSELYYNAERGNILQAPVVTIGGRDIHPYLVGDLRTHRLPG